MTLAPNPVVDLFCAEANKRIAELRAAKGKTTNLTKWGLDPVLYAKERLGIELEHTVDGQTFDHQARIARGLRDNKRIAVRSGHKIGKSLLFCVLALWWIETGQGGRVVMTSSSGRQVKAILWKELRKIALRVPDLPRPALAPDTGMQWANGNEIVGFTTSHQENFAGLSDSKGILFLVDEASGCPEWLFEVIKGNLAGGGKVALISNPTQTTGEFYNAFHTKRHLYKTFHVSSEETANAVTGKAVVPGQATKDWVEEMRDDLGEESPAYAVRVRGGFPTQSDDCVISLALVQAATERWADSDDASVSAMPLVLGVDVARFGSDETVVAFRRGARVLRLVAWHGQDTVESTGRIVELVRELRHPSEPLAVANIDDSGIGGAISDNLAAHHNDIMTVRRVVAGGTSPDPDKYPLMRDALWFGCKQWLAEGGQIPPDTKLEGDLLAVKYGLDVRSRRKVEPKKKTKERLKRSPDRGDALCLCAIGAGEDGKPSTTTAGQRRYGSGRSRSGRRCINANEANPAGRAAVVAPVQLRSGERPFHISPQASRRRRQRPGRCHGAQARTLWAWLHQRTPQVRNRRGAEASEPVQCAAG